MLQLHKKSAGKVAGVLEVLHNFLENLRMRIVTPLLVQGYPSAEQAVRLTDGINYWGRGLGTCGFAARVEWFFKPPVIGVVGAVLFSRSSCGLKGPEART